LKIKNKSRVIPNIPKIPNSVFVKEKGDTLIMERYRYLYRDKFVRDSVFINDTIRVPYPVEVVLASHSTNAKPPRAAFFVPDCAKVSKKLTKFDKNFIFATVIYICL